VHPRRPLRFTLILLLNGGCFGTPGTVGEDCEKEMCTNTSGGASTGSASGDTTGSSDSSGFCGDSVVQDDEMCDGGPGCDDECRFEDYLCNPLNDAGCSEGFRCGASDVLVESFSCQIPGTGDVGDSCTGAPENDSDCGAGLTCLFNFNTPLCDAGNCCVDYCDLVEPECPDGQECRAFFIGSQFRGLEHLGFCGEPL